MSETLSAKAGYQDLFYRSLDGILLLDTASGQVLEANDAASRILRVPLEHLSETKIFDFCRGDFLGELKKLLRIAARRYHPKTFEFPMTVGEVKDANIMTEAAASPLVIREQNANGVVEREILQLIFRDITEKKENEKQIADYIVQIEAANKLLEEMATTDGLTGLTNFRQFSKLLEMEHTRSARYGSNYAIIFCDIDHFKKYNDQNGHPAGDALLKQFTKILRACVRTTDIPARYGGEEFVVLCPETDAKEAFIAAERIRSTLQAAKLPFAEKQPMGFLSCSVGVAAFPADGANSADILKRSDELLYQSKAQGRNRVTVSPGALAQTAAKNS